MEGAFINMKLIIGNRELVPCSLFEKTCGIYQNCRSGTGNREPGTSSLFLIWVYITNVSKVQIGNKDPVPGSFLTKIGFILVSGFAYIISINGIR